ncbi:MAG: methyl-accepting chemotaxis protein [Peptococcaceae bacterium]|jgi:methyl-accepting chemotaxis protein|nr:methyl-accepting chemotaxis protein [Peptococcaceae bacterium]
MKLKWKIALPVLALMLLSTLLTTFLSYTRIKDSVDGIVDTIIDSSLNTLLTDVGEAQETNRVVSEEISLKNITLAHALAERVRLEAENGSLDLGSAAYFRGLASQFGVAEINIADSRGIIVGSNLPENYGFNYSVDDSTRAYMAIIADPAVEIIEEPRVSAVSGKTYQYLGAARADAGGFVQVGFDEEAVRVLQDILDIRHSVEDTHVGATGGAALLRGGVVVYSQNAAKIGQDASSEAWYERVALGRGKAWLNINGESEYAGYANVGDMTILILLPSSEYYKYLAPAVNVGVIGAVSALLVTALVYISVAYVLKPVGTLIDGSRMITGGDFRFKLEKRTGDEVGVLGENFERMADTFRSYIDEINVMLSHLADGNLRFGIEREYVGQFESIKHSINTINSVLNSAMTEIASASSQVSTGASQVADVAQTLAAGTTRQAASIDELSGSISEISGMAQENTKNATVALDDVRQAGLFMEAGMEQMSQMLTAMRVIDEKSQDISKTTKVIDDIAFQTNILALNAAVEAARAGQYGKGFAVVAEEVRNLASKSAMAAKETASLIESSSQSVAAGNKIVEAVNESLQAVAEIARRNAAQIADVQTVSVQQSEAMKRVNIGIDQIAQVVQQNSATAEESAAAAEEMSGQAAMMRELISQFKTKDSRDKTVV